MRVWLAATSAAGIVRTLYPFEAGIDPSVIPVALGLGLYESREAVRRIRFESKSVQSSASESPLDRGVVYTTSGLLEASARPRPTRSSPSNPAPLARFSDVL